MAQQDTMTSTTTALKRFPCRSVSSDQCLAELLSHCCLISTDTPSLPSSSPRDIFQNLYFSEHSYSNQELAHQSETSGGCSLPPPKDLHTGKYSPLPPQPDLELLNRHFYHPSIESCHFGGILDSPMVMTHPFLKSQAPLSPPLTLPTSTMSLPLAEGGTEDYPSLPLGQTHDLPDQEDISYSPPQLLNTLTPSSQSSSSTLQSPSPLSPVSPISGEWFSPAFPTHLTSSGLESVGEKTSDGLPYLFAIPDFHDGSLVRAGLASLHDFPTSFLNFQHPDGSDVRHNPLFSTVICDSPKPIDQEDLDPIDLEDNLFPPFSGLPFVYQAPVDRFHEVDQSAQQPQPEEQEPEQLSVPGVFYPAFSPSVHKSSLPELDDLGDADLDFPDSLVNLAPPPSPSRRHSFTDLPDDDFDSHLTIPETARGTSDDTLMLSPPESPGLTLQSLPGADADEDLIPVELASPKRTPDRLPVLHPRLLIVEDDSTLLPSTSRQSLSPEPCDTLDMKAIESQIIGDDELKRMFGLMKRTKEREGAARSMESILEEEERVIRSISRSSEGKNRSVDEAWNKLMAARRKSRRLKEKVRETATLLRLKLAERGWKTEKDASGKSILVLKSPATPPSPTLEMEDAMKVDLQLPKVPTAKRLRITNPQQLLVKMLMDRHEPQYSPGGRAGSPSRETTSPLARTSVSATDLESDNGTILEAVNTPDVEMHDVDGKEDLLDTLDMNMEFTGFS